MKIKNIYLTIALILIGFGSVLAVPTPPASFKQDREVLPAGGGTAQSNSFKNYSTVAEPVVGSHSSTNFRGTVGFLFDGTVPQSAIVVNNSLAYSKAYGGANFTVEFTGGSGAGAVSYSSDNANVATINSTTGEVTIIGLGTATLTVTKAADPGKYTQQTGTATLNVVKATLTATAENKERCGSASNPTLTVTYSGFVGNENATNALHFTAPTGSAIPVLLPESMILLFLAVQPTIILSSI